jgi:putative FmdB family regulatory protein
MPTYHYICPNCGHSYDKMQKISDETPAECPECRTPGERQISGGAGLVFKGSGFYITDYKRSGEKKNAAESDKAEGDKGKSAKKKDKPKPGADS